MRIIEKPVFPNFLDGRAADSHKGTYGHALLVAGSYGKMGAAVLAARALFVEVSRITLSR